MKSRFEKKVVVISGGADGVGKAAALRFAKEGAFVAILDINKEKGNKVLVELQELTDSAVFYHVDVSQADQIQSAINKVGEIFGRIDVLFNHAGTVIVKPFLETSIEDWNRLMAINVNSMFYVSQAVIPIMLLNGGGSIVNTASVSGMTASSLESAYCVSKGACIQLTRAIAVEFRDKGIRCNAVCPALIRTAHGLREAQELNKLGQSWNENDVAKMQGRICEPFEVAAAVLFLASSDASFINGEMLVVDNAQLATT